MKAIIQNNIFIIGLTGAGNLGDDLISVLLINYLQDTFPDIDHIGYLNFNQTNCFKQFINKKCDIIEFENPQRNNIFKYFIRHKKISKYIAQCKTIIVGGGGLIQDSHYIFSIHNFIKYTCLPESRRAIVYGVGLGLGPIRYKLNKFYLRNILKRFSFIQVRDNDSANLLKSTLNYENYKDGVDIVEGADLKHIPLFKNNVKENYLGCSIRPWLNLDIDKITRLIQNFASNEKLGVKLFVFEYAEYNQIEYLLAQQIKEKLINCFECSVFCYNRDDITEFVRNFCSVKYAIAFRYHANLLWNKVGIPVLPISYSHKVSSFYKKYNYLVQDYNTFKDCVSINDFIQIKNFGTFSIMKQKIENNSVTIKQIFIVFIFIIIENIIGTIISLKHRIN